MGEWPKKGGPEGQRVKRTEVTIAKVSSKRALKLTDYVPFSDKEEFSSERSRGKKKCVGGKENEKRKK